MNANAENTNSGIGCLPGFLRFLGQSQDSTPAESAPTAFPYERKDFLSPAERSFFGVLQQAVGSEFLLFSKIRLADLIGVRKGTGSYYKYFNQISAKHVDFLLCNQPHITPVLAIELDDSSHKRTKQRGRDEFVDSALEAAGLPLLRIPAQAGYDVVNIRDVVMNMVNP